MAVSLIKTVSLISCIPIGICHFHLETAKRISPKLYHRDIPSHVAPFIWVSNIGMTIWHSLKELLFMLSWNLRIQQQRRNSSLSSQWPPIHTPQGCSCFWPWIDKETWYDQFVMGRRPSQRIYYLNNDHNANPWWAPWERTDHQQTAYQEFRSKPQDNFSTVH